MKMPKVPLKVANNPFWLHQTRLFILVCWSNTILEKAQERESSGAYSGVRRRRQIFSKSMDKVIKRITPFLERMRMGKTKSFPNAVISDSWQSYLNQNTLFL